MQTHRITNPGYRYLSTLDSITLINPKIFKFFRNFVFGIILQCSWTRTLLCLSTPNGVVIRFSQCPQTYRNRPVSAATRYTAHCPRMLQQITYCINQILHFLSVNTGKDVICTAAPRPSYTQPQPRAIHFSRLFLTKQSRFLYYYNYTCTIW